VTSKSWQEGYFGNLGKIEAPEKVITPGEMGQGQGRGWGRNTV